MRQIQNSARHDLKEKRTTTRAGLLTTNCIPILLATRNAEIRRGIQAILVFTREPSGAKMSASCGVVVSL
jgi:hypothetical protein